MRVQVNVVTCPNCGQTIYSRARHDFRECKCKSVFIDGGFEYTRMGGLTNAKTGVQYIEGVTKQDLYNDWNMGRDEYGVIK